MLAHQNNCRVVLDGYGICRCYPLPSWMVALERYDLEDVTRGGEAWREMNLSPEGEWVKYDQVALIVQEQHEATERGRAQLKAVIKNHADSLRGIVQLIEQGKVGHALQWAKDALSGYTEPIESTVLKLQQQIAELKTKLATMTQERDDAVDKREGAYMRMDGMKLYSFKLQQQLAEAQATITRMRTSIEKLLTFKKMWEKAYRDECTWHNLSDGQDRQALTPPAAGEEDEA